MSLSLAAAAVGVLGAADPAAKVRLSRRTAEAWRNRRTGQPAPRARS
jgi:hypothetical protein